MDDVTSIDSCLDVKCCLYRWRHTLLKSENEFKVTYEQINGYKYLKYIKKYNNQVDCYN